MLLYFWYNADMKKKGFTLIELLVVIAIVSLLASIVFASLTNARYKGKDAAAKEQLKSMQTEANLYYDTNGNGSYGGLLSSTKFDQMWVSTISILDNELNHGCKIHLDGVYSCAIKGKIKCLCVSEEGLQEYPYGWGGVSSTSCQLNNSPCHPAD